jgi:hypothetical protein
MGRLLITILLADAQLVLVVPRGSVGDYIASPPIDGNGQVHRLWQVCAAWHGKRRCQTRATMCSRVCSAHTRSLYRIQGPSMDPHPIVKLECSIYLTELSARLQALSDDLHPREVFLGKLRHGIAAAAHMSKETTTRARRSL